MEQKNENLSQKRKGKIFDYAFCGTNDIINRELEKLKKLAEPEEWNSTDSYFDNDRLYYYIVKTFDRCYEQDKIMESTNGDSSIFNTGLLTPHGEEIYGYFVINKPSKQCENPQKWFFKSFIKESDRLFTDYFIITPKLANYTDNYADYYFDADKEISCNIGHIMDDHWSSIASLDDDNEIIISRFPENLVKLGKTVISSLIMNAFNVAKIRIKRNNRLVIPQYYNNEIMYLIPINIPITDDEYCTLALAVEKTNTGNYRANTIFTIDMAYSKARLIMKPESNWLIDNCKKK